MLENFPSIAAALAYSSDIVQKIRSQVLCDLKSNPGILVVTVGSIARKEASTESDLDYFIIYDDGVKAEEVNETEKCLKKILTQIGVKFPADEGAFGNAIKKSELEDNIGGNEDNNKHLTRRILFLLESEWLTNEEMYKALFRKLLLNYVKDGITQHALCRFLLNDLIRYYRTVCVDFEFKTVRGGKSWGDRNIKLGFARKMMYFSGVIAIAETVQNTADSKRESLFRYLTMSPVERVIDICGSRAEKLLGFYDEFLHNLSDPEFRILLRETPESREAHSENFRKIKNKSHHFSWEIANLLDQTYPASHPIHLAIRL